MKKHRIIFIPALVLLLAGFADPAQPDLPKPNWSRAMALQAVAQVNVRPALRTLFQLAREGSDEELIQALAGIDNNRAWPGPAREYILHSFAAGLGCGE